MAFDPEPGEPRRAAEIGQIDDESGAHHVGVELARGRTLADILAGMKMIAEGVKTTGAALALGRRYGVELPIATQMAAVLEGRSDVRSAVEALMLRRQKTETDGHHA